MSPSPEAVAHIEARRRLALATALATHRMWRQVDHGNLYQSWLGLAGNVLGIVMGGQLAAAQQTTPWLSALIGSDEERPDTDTVVPQAFTGVDGAGRPLAGVLMAPIWTALRLVAQGRPLAQAMAAGQGLLDAIVATAVADAGRAADATAMTAKPAVTGYIRVVEAGACDRCIVLAGAEYQTDKAFLRHPRCHCGMEPVTREHRPKPASPKDLVAQMSEAQRRKTFGEAGAKALSEGADLGQLVNARRGMQSATVFGQKLQITTEGTTRRGFAARRLATEKGFAKSPGSRNGAETAGRMRSKTPRLMPEEIFRIADDRTHAVRLLRLHGYIA
ncbi:VG15 protein [[Kitasatospora] papulosa]